MEVNACGVAGKQSHEDDEHVRGEGPLVEWRPGNPGVAAIFAQGEGVAELLREEQDGHGEQE